jgi:hypothetical protein
MNRYFRDASIFLAESARRVDDSMQHEAIIQSTLNLALGMERILKGILYDINPTYVLIDPVFKNSVQVLYENRILDACKGSTDLAANVNSDVITFRNSLLRVQIVSSVTYNNKSFLFNLSNARDIIAHNNLSLLEMPKLQLMLQRDFYPLMVQYSGELNIGCSRLLRNNDVNLAKVSEKYQESIEDKLAIKLDLHLRKWQSLSGNAGYAEEKDAVTAEILAHDYKFPVECPACHNTAVLYTKPEFQYNPYEKANIIVGLFIAKLQCRYCKLVIKDYKEIDFLGLSECILGESTEEDVAE